MKKVLIGFLVVVLCIGALTGCGTQNSAENSEVPMNALINRNTEIIRVGDESISVGKLQYYIVDAAMIKAYSVAPESINDLTSFDWNQKMESGKTLAEEVLQEASNLAVYESILIAKGIENNIVMTPEEKNAASQMVDGYILQMGEENFRATAMAMGIETADDYKDLFLRMQHAQKVEEAIGADPDAYIQADEDTLKQYKSDQKVTAKHILILSDSEKYADPEATIQEVLAKVKGGADFDVLIDEYNEDPGATKAGYAFGPGEMVPEFEKAAFDLDYNQVSDVVKTEYGYHIIKRVVGMAEVENMWMDQEEYSINEELLNSISVAELMQESAEAQKKLQELNQQQTKEGE